MSKPKKPIKYFSVDIDRNCSESFIIPARTQGEAKRKGWDRFCKRKPKKKHHQIWVDEIYAGVFNGERRRFVGTFVRFGKKTGWKGKTLTTILIEYIKDANNKTVCDHLWFNQTKEFESLKLKKGDRIAFDARVKKYYKGYQGYREDVDKPVEMDFRLANPTKVQVVPYTAEYETKVRELQEHQVRNGGESDDM